MLERNLNTRVTEVIVYGTAGKARRRRFSLAGVIVLGSAGGCAELPGRAQAFEDGGRLGRTVDQPRRDSAAAPANGPPSATAEESGAAITRDESSRDTLFWQIDARVFYGAARGFSETPSGGRPGTTSERRPKLNEIGIEDAYVIDLNAVARRGRDLLSLNGQFLSSSGENTLEHDLTSHARDFPAGARVEGSVDVYVVRGDYGRQFTLAQDSATGEPVLTLTPFAGVGVFHSEYKLTGGGEEASRTHTKPFPEVGAELTWRPDAARGLALSARVSGFPRVGDVPTFCSESLILSWSILERERHDVTGTLGVVWEQLDFQDGQRINNHLRFELGPAFVMGIGFRF